MGLIVYLYFAAEKLWFTCIADCENDSNKKILGESPLLL